MLKQVECQLRMWLSLLVAMQNKGISAKFLQHSWYWNHTKWFKLMMQKGMQTGWLTKKDNKLYLSNKGLQEANKLHLGDNLVSDQVSYRVVNYFVFPVGYKMSLDGDTPKVTTVYLADDKQTHTTDLGERLEVDRWQVANQIQKEIGINYVQVSELVLDNMDQEPEKQKEVNPFV